MSAASDPGSSTFTLSTVLRGCTDGVAERFSRSPSASGGSLRPRCHRCPRFRDAVDDRARPGFAKEGAAPRRDGPAPRRTSIPFDRGRRAKPGRGPDRPDLGGRPDGAARPVQPARSTLPRRGARTAAVARSGALRVLGAHRAHGRPPDPPDLDAAVSPRDPETPGVHARLARGQRRLRALRDRRTATPRSAPGEGPGEPRGRRVAYRRLERRRPERAHAARHPVAAGPRDDGWPRRSATHLRSGVRLAPAPAFPPRGRGRHGARAPP